MGWQAAPACWESEPLNRWHFWAGSVLSSSLAWAASNFIWPQWLSLSPSQVGDNMVAMEMNTLPPGGGGRGTEGARKCLRMCEQAQNDPGLVTQVAATVAG